MRRGRFWFTIALLLIMVGGGAASGTILRGYLEGDISMDVAPPLHLEEPWVECLPHSQNVFVSINVDYQAFRIAAEVEPGDCFLVHLPVVNQATVDVRTLLSISYPYGVSLWVTGSGVIDDVVAASYKTWKFTADAGAQGSEATPYDGLRIQVCVSPDYTGSSVEISGTIEGTSGIEGSSVIFSGQLSPDVLYLHNNPTPPAGDTGSQPNLPMDMYPPSTVTLYNYDTDLDVDPGRILTTSSVADFSAEFVSSENETITIAFTDLSISDYGITSWLWDFGDGDTSSLTNPTHVYEGEDSYIVTLTVTDGLGYDYTNIKTAMVYIDSITLLDITSETTGINLFQNWQIPVTEDLPIEGTVTAILWSATQYFNRTAPGILTAYLGDVSDAGYTQIGYSTLALNPWQPESATWVERKININDIEYTVPAGHILDLTVVISTGSSAMWLAYDAVQYPSRLMLNSYPEAEFSAEYLSSENTTVTVAFTDLSTSDEGITSWLWSFGDSESSTDQNPVHTYANEGAYTVSLTVEESDGDADTEVKTALVTVGGITLLDTGPTADFTASPVSGALPLTVRFTDTSTSDDGIVLWSWDFGNGQTSGMENPIVVYDDIGTYTVSLTVKESDGDSNTRTKPGYITVGPDVGPTADFTASPTSGHGPLTVNFTDQSTSGQSIVSWLWAFGDNTTSTESDPVHIYEAEGAYTVSLTVKEADNDSDTETKTDYINVVSADIPIADFTASPTSGSEPLTVDFTDQSSSTEGIVSWLWDFGDSSNSTLPNPTHVYALDGTYTVSLTITEADSDSDTETKTDYITVADTEPVADFTASPTFGYSPLTVDFTDQSTSNDGIVSWLWDFGDSGNSTLPNPTHVYEAEGTHTVSLTVTEADSDSDAETKTGYITVLPITTYAITYQGADDDGFVRTVEIETDGQITNSVLDSLEFDGWDGHETSIAHVSGSIYAIAYQRFGQGYLRTVEAVMDGQIRDTVIDTLVFDSTLGYTPNIIHVSGNIFAIAYQGENGDGYLRTVEIDTNGQITDYVIDTLEFDASDGVEPNIVHVYGNIYAIAYAGYYNRGYLKTVEIAADGQITDYVIDTLVFDNASGMDCHIIPVSGNIYAIAYRDSGDDGYLRTVEIATNGQITDSVIDTLEFDSSDGREPSIIPVSGNIYAIAYQRWGTGYLRTVEIAADGQITDSIVDTLVFDYTQGLYPSISYVSGNIYAIAYQGESDDGYLKTVGIATNGQITDSVIDTLEFDSSNGMMPVIIRLSSTPNQPPVAVNDSTSCFENWYVTISVLSNDYDYDGYTLKVTNLTQPTWGTAVLNPDGTVTYTPYEGYVGTDSFTYTANDGIVDSNVATVTINVTP